MLLAIIFGVYVEFYIFFNPLCSILHIYIYRLGNYIKTGYLMHEHEENLMEDEFTGKCNYVRNMCQTKTVDFISQQFLFVVIYLINLIFIGCQNKTRQPSRT